MRRVPGAEHMSDPMPFDRRHLFGIALTALAVPDALVSASNRRPAPAPNNGQAESDKTLGPLKQVDAGVLNVGCAEAGPADGTPVILLHGWPYDIHTYVDVAPLLAGIGYRVIVPYLRGYGSTRFLSTATFRNGQQSAVAVDIIALMDALKIEKA